jgi:probable phosphoglycerate mutase
LSGDEAARLNALVTFDVVFLARHGQTLWNRQSRKQGQLDSPLTPAGERHAADLGRLTGTFDVDLVASSPIGRARTTAQISADAVGRTVLVVDELAEVHHGEMAGLTSAEANVRFPGALDQRALDKYYWRFPGGESYADADQRAAAALSRIAQTGSRRPLIVSHEMIGRMLLRNLLGRRPADVLDTKQPHQVVYRVDLTSGQVDELATQLV